MQTRKQHRNSDYQLIIIGAGAAGLGASEQASALGVEHLVLEASHRIGGRGLTEYLEGEIPVDLGCHWMHSASINPYVGWAKKLGFEYQVGNKEHAMYFDGNWLDAEKRLEYGQFLESSYEKFDQLFNHDPSKAAVEVIDTESEWASHFYYWMSLMHSNDVDQVSVEDVHNYIDTGEDWPLKDGYGALISRQGQQCPVQLNTPVNLIDWSASPIKITANNGSITADKVLVTVSTGVLGSGQIIFKPNLPGSKQTAIDALPMGNYNYQFFSFDHQLFPKDAPNNINYANADIHMTLGIRPFNTPYVSTCTGGRFAWWLEKQGLAASWAHLEDALVDIFGSEVKKSLREFKMSAWGYDPLIQGAYSSQKPGYTGMRKRLAEPIDEGLYFAGEATSVDAFNTAHGAYLSGKRAVNEGFSKE